MITVFKIVHGLEVVPFDDLFTIHNTITRGNGYKLFKHFSYLNVRKFSFAERIMYYNDTQLTWNRYYLKDLLGYIYIYI